MSDKFTVGDLKQLLEGVDDDLPFMFAWPYGDHVHSTVAKAPCEEICCEVDVTYSDYHLNHKVLDDDDDRDGEFNEVFKAFVLQ